MEISEKQIGLIVGSFDMFNINHINLLLNAKRQCDYLIVGVLTDDLLLNITSQSSVIDLDSRCEILKSCDLIDEVVVINDFLEDLQNRYFTYIFYDDLCSDYMLKFKSYFESFNIKCLHLIAEKQEFLSDKIKFDIQYATLNNKVIGYTQGCYDMFHIGHLNIFKQAKAKCDYLIVGVNTDSLIFSYKGKYPIIPLNERLNVVATCKYVDSVVPADSRDKIDAFNKYHFNKLFIGSDWKGSSVYNEVEKQMNDLGVVLEFLNHTDGISSTILRNKIENK